MKRYLVTLTGRANCIYGKLRGNELVCSYVHANSKKKAIELFWGELEKNENFYCYSRRDFKIEAELWNENELDVNGNPLKDWESAIDFSNLHLIRFNHCTGKYEILSAEMEKAEKIKSEEAHQLAQAVAQMNADQVCSIVEETLKEQKELKEAQEDSNMKFKKIEAGCYEAENGMLIKKWEWDGLWKIFFNGNQLTVCETLKEAKGWIEEHERETHMLENMKAQELTDEPQESSEPVAQENIQPEPEDATEAKSEPQRNNRWNVSVFFSKDQILDELWRLRSDLSFGDVVGCTKRHEHQMNRFIKALDVAIDCINEIDELSQRASQSSSEEEKEISQENAEELTESNSEPLGDIKLSDFFSITEMLLMENSEPEWAYYHNNDLIWASSKRFSKDELLRMYANGYFMPYLTDMRKNLSRIQLKEYKTMGNTERCQNLWKQIEALDEEIARLFINGARM